MIIRSCFFMIVVSLSLFSSNTIAVCYFYGVGTMSGTQKFTVPVSLTLSVPPGIQNGQTIYQQNINLQNIRELMVKCDTTGQFLFNYDYLVTPKPASTLNSKIYETGVPGIGIKFSASGQDFPSTQNNTDCSNTDLCRYRYGWHAISSFSLVKIADNIAAGVITGNNLPTVSYNFGQEGNLLHIYQFSITGNIHISVPTCDISLASQHMTVQMGKHYKGNFAGAGTGTEWKDASIVLVNCTQFYGNSSAGDSGATFNGTSTTYSIAPNRAELTLKVLSGIEDAANGIMKIDEHPQKATGVGIQLSTTRSTSGKVDLNNPLIYPLPQDGSSTIAIPLYARYVQTQNKVQGGVANGRLEYTITYQ